VDNAGRRWTSRMCTCDTDKLVDGKVTVHRTNVSIDPIIGNSCDHNVDYIILYYVILYYIILYYIVLCIILYYIILYYLNGLSTGGDSVCLCEIRRVTDRRTNRQTEMVK